MSRRHLLTPLLALVPLVWLASQSGPDLAIQTVAATINTDPQTLVMSGTVTATVRNLGAGPTSGAFQLLAFEDRNNNRTYEAGTDLPLGTTNHTTAIAANGSAAIPVAVSGTVLFRGNIIYVAADSNNVIVETNETNNLSFTGRNSVFTGPADTALNPVLKWAADTFTELPDARSSLVTPTVGDINADGTPDVVFSTYQIGTRAYLRAVSGATGAVLFSVTNPDYELSSTASITLADIDADNRPELIAIDRSLRIIVFEHDGTFKWRSTQIVPSNWTGIIAADLDRNGSVELVVGNHVYSSTGTRLWVGAGAAGRGGVLLAPAVADLDLDGNLEVIAGPTAYRADGSILWNRLNSTPTLLDGPVAIANFDTDPYPEIVIRPYNTFYLYMLEHDGTVKWAVNPAVHENWGGQPSVGDVDGDGIPEIGVVSRNNYNLYRADGTILWSRAITEQTSGQSSSVFFDLNNDGRAEIIYADQVKLFIFRGTDGTILNQFNRFSSTAGEGPSVADVDRDGHADILIAGDIAGQPEGRGVRMYSGANLNWANTRPVWNQDAFTITNINDDLTVPLSPRPNWLVPGLNNFRTNGFVPESSTQPNSAPDATVSLLRRLDANFPASTTLIARLGNGGAVDLPVVRLEFRNGVGGPLLGAVNTSRLLRPGEYEDLQVVWANPPAGQVNLVVTADPANVVTEGDETNNQHATQLVIGQGPYVTVDDLLPRGKDAGADLKWTPVSGAVSYNIYRRSGSGGATLLRAAYATTTGAFSDQPLTNNTTYWYEVRWLNAQGIESRQGTEASVTPIPRTQRGDTPPSILSAPPTRGRTQTAFSYVPNVADPDAGEVLAWQITGAPTGLTQNASTGRLDWTPTAGQGGSYRLLLSVRDSRGRTTTQAFTLFIETQLVNTPPQILSSAITSGSAGRTYSYSVRGADPDAGDVLTYLLDSGPTGMTLNASTGLLQWTPGASGTFPVVLRVRDLAGAEARQSFTITVQNLNRGPQFTSTAPTTGAVNSSYAYAAAATDPDAGDTLSWRLVTAPTGMGVNSTTGLVFWTPAASQSGGHPVTLEVRDLLGATALQSWVVTVANGSSTNAPPVIATEPITSARVAIPYAYDVNAIDVENQTVTYSLTTAPSGAAINPSSGLIAWTPLATQVGTHDFVVRAADPLGLAAIQAFTVTVVNTPPATFELISPTLGADLSRPVNVVATITDPNAGGPALTWTVKLQRPGQPDRTLATGTGTVSNASIAALDPTTLPNDNYVVRVEIFKGTDGISREIPYTVSGKLKPGRLTASVTDLQIPITGIPLSVSRLYDSLDTRQSDFGAGWRLAYPGGVQDAPTESPLQGMRPGSKVYVTTPDGKRISFRFDPVATSTLFPYVVTPRFTPDAGATGTLTVAEPSVFLFDGVAYGDFNTPWNPSRYTYTAPTTVRYELDEVAGLQSIRDMNGNTLTFSAAGIVSSTGVALTLERDSAGRITRVREPGGAQLTYAYDAAGNLITATDQLGQTARYYYENPQFPNHLTRSEDPLGRATIRNVYDASGRLAASCPPDGNTTTLAGCVRYAFDANTLTETRTNARGFRRDFFYDDRGNLLTERRYLDATNFRDTIRTYDAAGNVLTQRDPGGNVTTFTYDAASKVLSRTLPGNRTTTFTYQPGCNSVATETDPAGGVIANTYDANCRLRFIRDRAGNTTEIRYDSVGRVTHHVDPRGATTQWTYTPQSFPATIRDARGNLTTLTWNAAGDLTSIVNRNGQRIDQQFDATHRRVRETWSNGRIISFVYNAAGQLTSATDGAHTVGFTLDALGRRTQESSPGFTIDYTYDAANNRISATDSLRTSMTYTFNGLDQLTALTHGGVGVSSKRVQVDYDAAGLITRLQRFASLSALNPVAQTGIEYDCGGCGDRVRAIRHTNAAGTAALQILTFTRNILGDIVEATDSEGLHTYQYDAARRLIGATHPNPAAQPAESYSYDGAGNRLTSHLSAAYSYTNAANTLLTDDQTEYSYDGEGNVTQKRRRSDGSTVQYEYDFRNRLTAVVTRDGSGVETSRMSFAYDAFNRRISATTAAGETRFYYDGANPVAMVAPGNLVTRRFYAPRVDEALSEETALSPRWLLTDQVGTVRTILDSAGAVLTQLTTDSFGRALASSNPAVSSMLSFNSRETIATSGDIYFRARVYDPRLGRFLQEDPLGPFGYDYGANSPLRNTDPFGLTAAVEYETLSEKMFDVITDGYCKLVEKQGHLLTALVDSIGAALGGGGPSFAVNLATIGAACEAKDDFDDVKDIIDLIK